MSQLTAESLTAGAPVPIAFPLRVQPSEYGTHSVRDGRNREIAEVSNAYDAGVLVDAYNRAHLAVA